MPAHKKSSYDLIRSQARPGRIRARQKQEAILLSGPGVQEFLSAVKLEHTSFLDRCIPGESICRTLDGGVFGWPEGHPLTDARDLARKVVGDKNDTEENKAECVEFLAALENGASRNHFIDPVACETAEAAVYAFAPANFVFWYWSVFRLADFFGSKRRSGEFVYTSRSEMNFPCGVEPILSKACEVLGAMDLPYLR